LVLQEKARNRPSRTQTSSVGCTKHSMLFCSSMVKLGLFSEALLD